MPIIDPLLTPFTLKGLTLRNRIVSTSHEPAYSEDGLPKDRYRAYHVEKAKGGVGMTMIGGSALVTRDAAPSFGNLQLWKDETVPWMRRLTDEVHEHGAAVMVQLSHIGQRTSNYSADWLPAIAASRVHEPAHRSFTKEAEWWDLDRVKDGYVSVAQRMKEAGMDGVEFMVHGQFLDSFWTPYWNHREDEYGGSYENRMRYPLEVIRAVRKAVGPDFILGARPSFDEMRTPGLDAEASLRVAQDLVNEGIDFFSLLHGSIESDGKLAPMIPPMGTPSAPHLSFAAEIKKRLNVPILHAGRIADVPTARTAIRDGMLDLVGMTRAMLADPYLVRKITEGHEDQIRPCVGANMCIDNIYLSGSAYCIHNPSTGRETELPQTVTPAGTKRRVAVVGGGPGGLEAARVLGERGHDVTLFEASSELGGQLSLAAQSPRRRDLQGIIDWRRDELARLGVDVHLDAYVEAEDLQSETWDDIIVATGGLPAAEDIPGADLATDTWDVLSGAAHPSGHVLVYDDHGGHQALDATEALVREGATVEIVSPERGVSPDVGGLTFWYYEVAQAQHGVETRLYRRLLGLRRADGRIEATFGVDGHSWTEQRVYDSVVVECGTEPIDDLYRELVPGSTNLGAVDYDRLLALEPQTAEPNPDGAYRVYRIGDAISSRNVPAAMLDAARLCRAI